MADDGSMVGAMRDNIDRDGNSPGDDTAPRGDGRPRAATGVPATAEERDAGGVANAPMPTRRGRFSAHLRTPLYRNAYALVLSVLGTSGLGLVYWVLAARFYSTDDVGRNSAILTTMMFLAGLGEFNLRIAMIRFIPGAGRATRQLVGFAYLFSVVMGTLVGVVFLAGLDFFSPALGFLRGSTLLATWFIASILTWCIFGLQDNVLTGLRQSIWIPIENVIFGLVKIVLLIAFIGRFGDYGIFASWTIPVAISLVPINYLIFRRLIPAHVAANPHDELPLDPARIARYVASDYVGAMLLLSIAAILSIIVINGAGASANAFFYQAWTIAVSLRFISTSLSTSLTVEASKEQAQLSANSSRFLVNTLLLVVPAVLIVIVLAPYILGIFGPDYATQGTPLLRLLALGALPGTLHDLYRSYARVQHRMRELLVVQGVLWFLTIGLSYALLPRFGIIGIGIACVVSDTIVAVYLLLGPLRPLLRGSPRPGAAPASPTISSIETGQR